MPTQTQLADNIYHHGFHIIDHFLGAEHYRALRETIQIKQSEGYFKPAKIGHNLAKNHHAAIRNDEIFWLDKQCKNDAINAYFSAIDSLREALNQSLFLGLIDYEAHFAVYQPNRFYKKHIDQFKTKKDRRISCVYYLNERWQPDFGGELRLYDKADQPLTKIMPEGNRFVCFNSDIPHEVCTAYRTRYSIAAWLKIRPLSLAHY